MRIPGDLEDRVGVLTAKDYAQQIRYRSQHHRSMGDEQSQITQYSRSH